MANRTANRALTLCGALTALAGTAVLAASPALADTDVIAFDHGGIHSAPAVGQRVVGHVNPGHHYIGECWTNGDLINDHRISNRNWVRLKLAIGATGYVPALYLKGNDRATSPTTADIDQAVSRRV